MDMDIDMDMAIVCTTVRGNPMGMWWKGGVALAVALGLRHYFARVFLLLGGEGESGEGVKMPTAICFYE